MDENPKNDPEERTKELEKQKKDPEKRKQDLEKQKQDTEERDKDLDDVRKTESRRGRRPIDLDARRRHHEKVGTMRTYLDLSTEEEFVRAMRGVGLRDGSPELLAALQAWREHRS